jgi:hypothetical protein
MAMATKLAAENAAATRKREDHVKHDKNKSYSWNAGYHKREAKRAAKKVEYHTKMAAECKDRRKESK